MLALIAHFVIVSQNEYDMEIRGHPSLCKTLAPMQDAGRCRFEGIEVKRITA